MAGSEGVDDLRSRIDSKLKRVKELESMIANERNTVHELQSRSIDDFEASLRDEQECLRVETEDLGAKIFTQRDLVARQREAVDEIISEKNDLEQTRIKNLDSYLKNVSIATPKFSDVLTDYSKENLTKDIDRIRLDGRRVVEEIAVVDRKIEDLVSKYDLNVIGSIGISGKKSDITELRDAKTILIESRSKLIWGKKQNKFFNKELEKKSVRHKRQIYYYQPEE